MLIKPVNTNFLLSFISFKSQSQYHLLKDADTTPLILSSIPNLCAQYVNTTTFSMSAHKPQTKRQVVDKVSQINQVKSLLFK